MIGLFLLVVGGLGALVLAIIVDTAGFIRLPGYVPEYILAGMGIALGLALLLVAVVGLWLLITRRDA